MDVASHVRLLAHYNQWMNEKVHEAASRLTPEQLAEDRQAFFGSIIGTLNHLLVGDLIWLKRFAAHPARYAALEPVRAQPQPAALDQILFQRLEPLTEERRKLDIVIRAWADEMKEEDFAHPLVFRNMKGQAFRKSFGSLVLNLFNHQTHHRGQVTTLLSQAGLDIGVTDLLALIPEADRRGREPG